MRPFLCASPGRLLLWTLLLSCTAAAHAGRFDEKTKAPRTADAAEFKRHVQDYFAAYEQLDKRSAAGALIRNVGLYAQWFDVDWRLRRSLDQALDLGDLSEFGLLQGADGSYTVKGKDYPQWMPIDSFLSAWRAPGAHDAHAPALKERGFRDQDLALLKNYVDSNNWERAALIQNKPLIESFAAVAQARHRAKRPIDPEQTLAFMYQCDRNSREARRAWAVGLLDALDNQRQRILESYVEELGGTRTYGRSDARLDQQLERTVAPLISGEYIEMLRQQELRVMQ